MAEDTTPVVPVPAKPKRIKVSTTVSTVTAPTSIATARAARKRKRLTGEEYKSARDFARGVTGYNDTSPIWGKPMVDVLMSIAALLEEYISDNGGTAHFAGHINIQQALTLNRELQKRIATNQVIAHQSK